MPQYSEATPRSVPIPLDFNTDVAFYSPGGTRIISPGENVGVGYQVQISVWELSVERIQDAFASLRSFMIENQFSPSSVQMEHFYDGDDSGTIPYSLVLSDRHSSLANPAVLFAQENCAGCDSEIDYPSLNCWNCGRVLYCPNCRRFSNHVHNGEQGYFCERCGIQCADCGNSHHGLEERCPECFPSVRCDSCRRPFDANQTNLTDWTHPDSNNTFRFCSECYAGLCQECGANVGSENIIAEEGNRCTTCVSMSSDEEWDDNSELENESLSIPTIPGRETIRLVGVEIEGANGEGYIGTDGGNLLAQSLYDAGLTTEYQMGGYHSGHRRSLVHVERDSSVDWEMVIGPLNVANSTHVNVLNQSVRTVRKMINEKVLRLDMRAGLHIHVGADRVPFHSAYNLHRLYMYSEDFLYRFGAAKWPYHRSIYRRGRDQAGKSPIAEGKLQFARTFTGQRYYGLSFDNYFARYFEGCGCGARTYGLFDECTCDLGKCTFEFRLFNTTANTIKLHAYLAMCQALVAKAIDMDEIKDVREYPALDFLKSRVSDMHPSTRRKMIREWEKRIEFINTELPLTPEEKVSIHYCVINSEMGKVVENADILLEMEDN